MSNVCILDYGMGNIRSLKNAINKIGHKVNLYSEKSEIKSNYLIIPGVGAFDHAINILKKKKIDIKIKKFLEDKNNFLLGICLGKQLFYSLGEENKITEGLNLIDGKVHLLSYNKIDKLPNVGWKSIELKENKSPKFGFLSNFNKKKFYFIHSYIGCPKKSENILATTKFKNLNFCSIVTNNKNLIGVQFHPEKSSETGLEFLDIIIRKFS